MHLDRGLRHPAERGVLPARALLVLTSPRKARQQRHPRICLVSPYISEFHEWSTESPRRVETFCLLIAELVLRFYAARGAA